LLTKKNSSQAFATTAAPAVVDFERLIYLTHSRQFI